MDPILYRWSDFKSPVTPPPPLYTPLAIGSSPHCIAFLVVLFLFNTSSQTTAVAPRDELPKRARGRPRRYIEDDGESPVTNHLISFMVVLMTVRMVLVSMSDCPSARSGQSFIYYSFPLFISFRKRVTTWGNQRTFAAEARRGRRRRIDLILRCPLFLPFTRVKA